MMVRLTVVPCILRSSVSFVAGVTVKDGSIYVLGGESNIDCALLSGSSLPIDDVEVYTPNTANIVSVCEPLHIFYNNA